jgi:hypothetical protein
LRVANLILPTLAVTALAGAPSLASASSALAAGSPGATASGGAGMGVPAGPVSTAAPAAVRRAIWAGNQIRTKPYVYGGGHGSFNDRGYDCSGSVSYVLHAAGLLRTPYDSGDFMRWGHGGLGQWITVYTNPGHAFVQIAGIRLDTSREADPHPAPGTGPRWRPVWNHPSGYASRHPSGF